MPGEESRIGAHFAPRDGRGSGSGVRPNAAHGNATSSSPGETAVFLAAAQRGSIERGRETSLSTTSPDETAVYLTAAKRSRLSSNSHAESPLKDELEECLREETEEEVERLAARKANSTSILVILSRITGFGRTMAQANALSGVLMSVASCYTVAAGMPNMLYELVMGGMLVTSFLPVYLSVRNNRGREASAEYASNLLTILLVIMGVLSVLSFVFAGPIIWTQSAGASADFDFDLAVWFFRFFAFEVILYGVSSVVSGVLNAERDYFASNAAPMVNNIITIASFMLYSLVVKGGLLAWDQALIILAVGNPLGVVSQVLIQLPALRRHGVRLRLKIDLHDPALRETLAIGLPTLIVTFASYPTNAVQSSCALQVTSSGAAIAYYSRVWYVLPFSILAIPISVTMFTELSNYRVAERMDAYRRALSSGMRKIIFTMIPCALLLIVFAPVLVALLGGFDAEDAAMTATYLQVQAVALPLYALSTYLQKVCSSLMKMKIYAFAACVAAATQVVFCIVLTPVYGLYVVPLSSTFHFLAVDVVTLLSIRREVGSFGFSSVMLSGARALVFGLLGSAVGAGLLMLLTTVVGPVGGSMLRGLVYAAFAGLPALLVAYGSAYALGRSEAPFFDALFSRVSRALHRG